MKKLTNKKSEAMQAMDRLEAKFENLKNLVSIEHEKFKASLLSENTENILKVIPAKKISQFSNTGGHIIVPQEFVGHCADVIIRKDKFENGKN